MEQLSYDIHAETYVVRRFPTSTKIFMYASAGTGTRDLPHALATQPPRLHMWDRPPDVEENKGAGFAEGWEDKRDVKQE